MQLSYRFKAASVLRTAGIPASVILDAAVGYYISKVDMVLVGAEGVVENGGIINQVPLSSFPCILFICPSSPDRHISDGGDGQGH